MDLLLPLVPATGLNSRLVAIIKLPQMEWKVGPCKWSRPHKQPLILSFGTEKARRSKCIILLVSLRPCPKIDPQHSAHLLHAQEGNQVQFMRPQWSGAEIFFFFFWKIQEWNNLPIDIRKAKRVFQCIISRSNCISSINGSRAIL